MSGMLRVKIGEARSEFTVADTIFTLHFYGVSASCAVVLLFCTKKRFFMSLEKIFGFQRDVLMFIVLCCRR